MPTSKSPMEAWLAIDRTHSWKFQCFPPGPTICTVCGANRADLDLGPCLSEHHPNPGYHDEDSLVTIWGYPAVFRLLVDGESVDVKDALEHKKGKAGPVTVNLTKILSLISKHQARRG